MSIEARLLSAINEKVNPSGTAEADVVPVHTVDVDYGEDLRAAVSLIVGIAEVEHERGGLTFNDGVVAVDVLAGLEHELTSRTVADAVADAMAGTLGLDPETGIAVMRMDKSTVDYNFNVERNLHIVRQTFDAYWQS